MIEKLGRYEILEEIGQGGFAVVYRARDTDLDRIVALKELKSLLLVDSTWVRRFRREARSGAGVTGSVGLWIVVGTLHLRHSGGSPTVGTAAERVSWYRGYDPFITLL